MSKNGPYICRLLNKLAQIKKPFDHVQIVKQKYVHILLALEQCAPKLGTLSFLFLPNSLENCLGNMATQRNIQCWKKRNCNDCPMLDKLASRSGHSKTMHVYVCEGRRNDIFLGKPTFSFLLLRPFKRQKLLNMHTTIGLSNYGKPLLGFLIPASLYEASWIMSPGQTKKKKKNSFL